MVNSSEFPEAPMKWLRLVPSMALAGQLAFAAAPAERDK
jgi:hypothetical protein